MSHDSEIRAAEDLALATAAELRQALGSAAHSEGTRNVLTQLVIDSRARRPVDNALRALLRLNPGANAAALRPVLVALADRAVRPVTARSLPPPPPPGRTMRAVPPPIPPAARRAPWDERETPAIGLDAVNAHEVDATGAQPRRIRG